LKSSFVPRINKERDLNKNVQITLLLNSIGLLMSIVVELTRQLVQQQKGIGSILDKKVK